MHPRTKTVTGQLLSRVIVDRAAGLRESASITALWVLILGYAGARLQPGNKHLQGDVAAEGFIRVLDDVAKLIRQHDEPVENLDALIASSGADGRPLTVDAYVKKRVMWSLLDYLKKEAQCAHIPCAILDPSTSPMAPEDLLHKLRILGTVPLEDLEFLSHAIQHSAADGARAMGVSAEAYRQKRSRIQRAIRQLMNGGAA